jgi:phenylpropionate dioxygenase-like ring-hydroxylating dioxygenase large terminal subunit
MNSTSAVARNYPYNCWWVAGFSHEIGRSLLARWILDTPVLLYRTEAGEAVAMEDRCPHRLAPLSRGTLQGDEVECGYHGFRFGPHGRCTRVPTQRAPAPIGVEVYPTKELAPFVWVYLGDRAAMDQVPTPNELSWSADPNFAVLSGCMEIRANYLLLKENVLDLTHFGYVHAKTFGITDWTHPPEVTHDENTVTYRQRFEACPLPAGYALALGLEPGVIWNRETYGSFVSPALQVSANDMFDPSKPGEPPMGRYRIAHATTPIDQRRMLYFWVFGRDHARTGAQMDQLRAIVEQGFGEDQAILEAVQGLADRVPRRGSSGERSVKADAAGVYARRIVERWMARETIPHSQEQPGNA